MSVAIIDYGMGNLRSVKKAFSRIGVDAIITSDEEQICHSQRLVLPGVGHFKKGMENLNDLGLIQLIRKETLTKKKPILGICLGMQLLTSFSEEGHVTGLNLIQAKTQKFPCFPKESIYRVPHIGWNTINIGESSPLFMNIDKNDSFYFVHSYYVEHQHYSFQTWTTDYGIQFTSVIESENIYGTQFHPEKSHDAGLQLLRNFCELT